MPVTESFLAFLDTETTGLTPGHDEVIEIATILTDWDLKEISRIEMKVKVTSPNKITPDVAKINGYNEEVWMKEARPFMEWQAWLNKHVPFGHVAVPVGHNVSFDREMIDLGYYKPCARFCPLSYHKVDTVSLAGVMKIAKIIDVPNLKLATVAPALGIAKEQKHRAMDDCELSKKILEYAVNLFKESAV
jgi:DNA polymerase III alpha subunit (gram-positive type)